MMKRQPTHPGTILKEDYLKPLSITIHEMERPQGEMLVYQTDDGRVRLDVRLQDETVWLTQPMMAELFQTTQQNISQHILNIYDEGELADEATHKRFLSEQ